MNISFFKSKRFFFTLLALLLWFLLVIFTINDPLIIATSLTIILAPYLTAESMKKSDIK